MNIKRIIIASLLMLSIWAVATQCKSTNNDVVKGKGTDTVITPVELPVVVPGFKFPEDSTTILGWLKPYDSASVYKHAWGVWAGLTAQSGETYQGDSLLVYQTWLGIGDIQTIIQTGQAKNAKSLETKSGRVSLTAPEQIKHAKAKLLEAKAKNEKIDTSAGQTFGTNFWVAVAYDPNAAKHTVSNSLLKQSVLLSYSKTNAIGAIPAFPKKSITTKPVYYVGHKGDSLIRIYAWPGPPPSPVGYGPSAWNNYVYADVTNSQPKGKKLVPVTTTTPTQSQIQAATCNLNDFINFKIDSTMAAYLNTQQAPVQGDSAKAGDIALLVAMHVTTKEISNWTWQTFYWDPNPSTPTSPSSNLAYQSKPTQYLSNAAAHYSVSTAYLEVTPNQPITGGTNKGDSAMIGYNPYLEAGFTPPTFVGFAQSFNPNYQYGVQTNCMSCHALAVMNASTNANTNPIYTTDQYIDMNNAFFKNQVQLDFAWSIEAGIIYDDTTAASKAKLKK